MPSDPSKIFLDPGQTYTNADKTLERITANPAGTSVSLDDLFGDETGAAAFIQYGFGPDLARYVAKQSAAVTRRFFDAVLDGVQWGFLDSFDPLAHLSPGLRLHLGPLPVSRELMRDHLDPERTPQDDYGVTELSAADQTGVLLSQLLIHLFISHQCQSRLNSATG
ncbi:hypothetical protein [Rhodococcus koreensis]|uniref:hypothetical protein n=1 Tax=Rhodococcus koreensis TaxID=99653 RepID=UPI001981CBA6|nr:hypothetical protein [Rhodococcus koreensis]QSE87018.1 hypothetical protein JWS14_49485 [Rhodococcus koreensis]